MDLSSDLKGRVGFISFGSVMLMPGGDVDSFSKWIEVAMFSFGHL